MTSKEKSTTRRGRPMSVSELRDAIRMLILNGDLPPGARLRQQHLAKQFDVSINAVREALMELKGAGWVDGVQHQGVFVQDFDTRQLLDSLEVREVLEGLSARLCCRRINRETLDSLRTLVQQIFNLSQAAENEANLREAIHLDRHFHEELSRIAGNPILASIGKANRVMGPIAVQPPLSGAHERTLREHLAILDAIEQDRPDDAENLMRVHVRTHREIVERSVQNQRIIAPAK